MPAAVPGRCDRRRPQVHAYGGAGAVHGVRAVHSALPGRLHHARAAREPGAARTCAHSARQPAPLCCPRAAPRRAGGRARSPRTRAQARLRLRIMHPATRKAIFRRLQAANPTPTTELLHTTPFELLVAVMLSAQDRKST